VSGWVVSVGGTLKEKTFPAVEGRYIRLYITASKRTYGNCTEFRAGISPVDGGGGNPGTWQIAANTDDAMCSTGTFYPQYIIPFHSSYMNGLRWSIDIPVGSTITSAYLKLRCKNAGTGVITSKAEVFDEDSCAAFTVIFWARAVMAGFVDIYINPNWAV
ncbi:unnamed protein product, partial [marine sediment metagenome]